MGHKITDDALFTRQFESGLTRIRMAKYWNCTEAAIYWKARRLKLKRKKVPRGLYDNELFRMQWIAGIKRQEMADFWGICKDSVTTHAISLGLKPRRVLHKITVSADMAREIEKRFRAGETRPHIGTEFGIPTWIIEKLTSHIPSQYHKPKFDRKTAEELRMTGLQYKEIGAILGVSATAIWKALNASGVRSRRNVGTDGPSESLPE